MQKDDHELLQARRGRGRPKRYVRRMTLRITAEQDVGLRAIAEATGLDYEAVIRGAIDRELRHFACRLFDTA